MGESQDAEKAVCARSGWYMKETYCKQIVRWICEGEWKVGGGGRKGNRLHAKKYTSQLKKIW